MYTTMSAEYLKNHIMTMFHVVFVIRGIRHRGLIGDIGVGCGWKLSNSN